jgi:hypothetical protein
VPARVFPPLTTHNPPQALWGLWDFAWRGYIWGALLGKTAQYRQNHTPYLGNAARTTLARQTDGAAVELPPEPCGHPNTLARQPNYQRAHIFITTSLGIAFQPQPKSFTRDILSDTM